MFKMKNLLSLIILFFYLSTTSVLSQSSNKNKMSKADKAFMMQNYHEAEKLYKSEYAKEKNRAKKAELIFLQAECARNIGTPIYLKKASSMYKRSIKAKYPHAEVYLRYAQVLQKQENFIEAITQYEKYRLMKPNDNRSDKGIESCNFAINAIKFPSRYKISPFQHNTNQKNIHLVMQVEIMMSYFSHLLEMELLVRLKTALVVILLLIYFGQSMIRTEKDGQNQLLLRNQ